MSLCPSSGPVNGETTVRIHGRYFALGSDYRVSVTSNMSDNIESFPASSSMVRALYDGDSASTSGLVSMRFQTPTLPFAGSTGVRVSLNAQQFSPSPGVVFNAYAHPHVSRISPSCGPIEGDTSVAVSGVNFLGGSHYLASWARNVTVNATAVGHGGLQCSTPLAPEGSERVLQFEVTLNGQQHTNDGRIWTYTPTPRVSHIFPTSGVSGGGVTITVYGFGFEEGCDLKCEFRGLSVVNARFDQLQRTLLCDTPMADHLTVSAVEISLNAQQYTHDKVNHTFFDHPTIGNVQPISTILTGGTTVSIFGNGFQDFSTAVCKFGLDTIVPATHVNISQIRCATPPISTLAPVSYTHLTLPTTPYV